MKKIDEYRIKYEAAMNLYEDPIIDFLSNNESKIINATSLILFLGMIYFWFIANYNTLLLVFLIFVIHIRLIFFQKSLILNEKLFEHVVEAENEE